MPFFRKRSSLTCSLSEPFLHMPVSEDNAFLTSLLKMSSALYNIVAGNDGEDF
jgi:hypothetical protein